MKNFYLFVLLISNFFSVAQTDEIEFENMVEAEMKSAASIQNFQVNPNTQNYDITYHELRFTVDPSVYNIVGQVTTTFTALEDMNSVIFDLTDVLTVSSVTMGATPLTFTQYTPLRCPPCSRAGCCCFDCCCCVRCCCCMNSCC